MRDSTLSYYPAEHQADFMARRVALAVENGEVVVASLVSLGEDETCVLVLGHQAPQDHFVVQRCEGVLVGSRFSSPREESTRTIFTGPRIEAMDEALKSAGYTRR